MRDVCMMYGERSSLAASSIEKGQASWAKGRGHYSEPIFPNPVSKVALSHTVERILPSTDRFPRVMLLCATMGWLTCHRD